MTQKDIIRMAREAGLIVDANQSGFVSVEVFAELVAAAEREACAKVVEASPSYDWHKFACEAAAAIRARGEALAQPEERNFCSRCGKRTADIHTCTPPKENT